MEEKEPVRVAVIGGSYAGSTFAMELEKKIGKLNVDITLIERRDKMHHCVAAFRSVVEPNFAEKLWIPYDKLFTSPRHRVLQHTVTEVHNKHLVTKDNTIIAFDYLVIASGSKAPRPCKTEAILSQDGIAEAEQILGYIKEAGKILVIGGGACGVELSAEIKSMYPEKEVTLVHKHHKVLDYPCYSDSFKSMALDHLHYLGVNVILDAEVQVDGLEQKNSFHIGKTTTTTSNNLVIESDIQFYTMGMDIDTSHLKTLKPTDSSIDFSLSSIIDPICHDIRVRSTLQLDHLSFQHIFAIGDICNIDPTRTAYGAQKQAIIAAKNISILLHNSNEILVEHKPTTMMVVVMGMQGGVAHTPLIGALGSWFVRWTKSKDLNVQRRWKLMGLNPPS